MSDAYIGEIRPFAFGIVPQGWALCNGQLLSIQSNQALFAILGTRFGGNGVTTFGLPDLRGRTPIHTSSAIPVGASGGETAHTLTIAEMPAHTHQAYGSSQAGDQAGAESNTWGATPTNMPIYAASTNGTNMNQTALSLAGGGAAHDNMQPYSVISFCIALQGEFPTRN